MKVFCQIFNIPSFSDHLLRRWCLLELKRLKGDSNNSVQQFMKPNTWFLYEIMGKDYYLKNINEIDISEFQIPSSQEVERQVLAFSNGVLKKRDFDHLYLNYQIHLNLDIFIKSNIESSFYQLYQDYKD